MARIQPGLERIGRLLKGLEFPWKAIHVAGTNGKGSICHYASHLLARRLIKTGTFTSPHLCYRWDGITINNKPVYEGLFRKIEAHYVQLNEREKIGASPFEILTATAFHIFNVEDVKVGVVEVGMGGKLDATNILNNQAVSVISSIARDHQDFLGSSLEAIAEHKAGILRPNVPYLVNPMNEWNIQEVIDSYAREIGAGPRIELDSVDLRETLYSRKIWHRLAWRLVPYQRDNTVLALRAAQEAIKSLGGPELSNTRAAEIMWLNHSKTHKGRTEWLTVQPIFGHNRHDGRHILVDGAHNPAAAKGLKEFVKSHVSYKRTISNEIPPEDGWPTTWVLAMTEGKDAYDYLATLLQHGDNVVTTSFGPVDGMPWVKPMDPEELLEIAKQVEPGITGLAIPWGGPLPALCAAKYFAAHTQPIVLTGSLYLVGELHREVRDRQNVSWAIDPQQEGDRKYFKAMLDEARQRVYTALSKTERVPNVQRGPGIDTNKETERRDLEEKRNKMQDELAALDNELIRLDSEQLRILKDRSLQREASRYASAEPSISSGEPLTEEPTSKEPGADGKTGKSAVPFRLIRQERKGLPIRKFMSFDPKEKGRKTTFGTIRD